MKTTFYSLTVASVISFAYAQPAVRKSSASRDIRKFGDTDTLTADRMHQHQHAQRDVVYLTTTVAAPSPDAMVVVDQNGNVLSTSYANQPTAPPVIAQGAPAQPSAYVAPAPEVSPQAPAPAPEASPQAQAPVPEPPAPAPEAPAPVPVPASPPANSEAKSAPETVPTTPSSGGQTSGAPANAPGAGNGLGINYSPYHADQTCKSADQVKKDLDQINGYGIVRSYGVDCNQVPNIISAAKTKQMKVMLGIFNIDSAADDAKVLVQGVGNDWGVVDSISVGNEAVNSGKASADQVVSALNAVRGVLSGSGYKGPVVAVDTFDTLIKYPQLCQNSDFAAANAHAFFDSQITADRAGQWAQDTAKRVSNACGKKTVITESGWPSQGNPNGAAVPNKQNQEAAIQSLKSAFGNGGLFLFSAYNNLWKQDFDGSHGCEKFWGILGDSSN